MVVLITNNKENVKLLVKMYVCDMTLIVGHIQKILVMKRLNHVLQKQENGGTPVNAKNPIINAVDTKGIL